MRSEANVTAHRFNHDRWIANACKENNRTSGTSLDILFHHVCNDESWLYCWLCRLDSWPLPSNTWIQKHDKWDSILPLESSRRLPPAHIAFRISVEAKTTFYLLLPHDRATRRRLVPRACWRSKWKSIAMAMGHGPARVMPGLNLPKKTKEIVVVESRTKHE